MEKFKPRCNREEEGEKPALMELKRLSSIFVDVPARLESSLESFKSSNTRCGWSAANSEPLTTLSFTFIIFFSKPSLSGWWSSGPSEAAAEMLEASDGHVSERPCASMGKQIKVKCFFFFWGVWGEDEGHGCSLYLGLMSKCNILCIWKQITLCSYYMHYISKKIELWWLSCPEILSQTLFQIYIYWSTLWTGCYSIRANFHNECIEYLLCTFQNGSYRSIYA